MTVNLLADQYLQYLDELLPEEVRLTRFDPAKGLPDHTSSFDALLVRTVTPINAESLPDVGKLKFIGTGTAGTDHIDHGFLKREGVAFSQSEGCNANAVAEFVITGLFYWAWKTDTDLYSKKVGVVGCGNTGGSVIRLLKKLNIDFVAYDPPKAESETGFISATEAELLKADILTFHTPLNQYGKHPTVHLADKKWLQNGFDLIINTSRGGVVNEKSMFELWQSQAIRNYILDVWEGEPDFNNQIAKHALIATPHIAGYSEEAKFKATEIVLSKLLNFFDLNVNPNARPKQFKASQFKYSSGYSIAELLWQNNQINFYDTELRKLIGLPSEKKSKGFADLRSKTALRHEYSAMLKSKEVQQNAPQEFQIFDHSATDK